ncbi:prephenate dehydrogenase [Cenarchaeum symbiosum A]|uniref:Prephenate dehydrogenase n=1 Tax=Cenarchaeum symbiosum (strain A) TaxID=414004 RepID=A0RU40_CENSY|nr:prephenate dehydrogenase [Cenarchaeum symbiosum A]
MAVIGAGGRMGSWFAKFFADAGYEVTGYDSENKVTGRAVIKSESLVGCVLKADYVLLCTPTRRTPEIIRLIAKEMRRGAYMIEISSQKSKTVSALSRMPPKINPICVHPMFGPGTRRIANRNMISIPVRDAKKELTVAKELFPGASFVTIDAAEHDKRMAVILGLTHLVNLVFASVISRDDKSALTERMSGTTFRAQKIISESILTESPELIETVISNPEIRRYAEEFWKDIGRLLTAIQEAKTEEITEYIRACHDRLTEHSDLDDSYKRLYTMVNALDRK